MKFNKVVGKHFVKLPPGPNGKLPRQQCKFCGKSQAQHISRMAEHLIKNCSDCPTEIKKLIERAAKGISSKNKKKHRTLNNSKSSSGSTTSFVVEELDPTELTIESNLTETKNKTDTNGKIHNFMDKITNQDKLKIDVALATAIYESGTPLSITEHDSWRKVFSMLRPCYTPPSRHDLSHSLLDRVYQKVADTVSAKVNNATAVGLQSDGWSNIKNDGIINIILSTPEPIFYKTVHTGVHRQTGSYIADELSKVIDEVGPKKVISVVTDNAAANKLAWEILNEKYEKSCIAFHGCAAHILHLLFKDVLDCPSCSKLLKSAVSIVKAIKGSHILLAHFTEIQRNPPPALQHVEKDKVRITLKLPGQTRWGSSLHCLESLNVNKHNLQTLAITPDCKKMMKAEMTTLILTEDFWDEIEKFIQLLKPIMTWLTKMESDTSYLSEVPQMFLDLHKHFDVQLQDSAFPLLDESEIWTVFNKLEKRKQMCLTRLHFAANILDPYFKGKSLQDEQEAAGEIFITEMSRKFDLDEQKVLLEYAEYKANSGLWGKNIVINALQISKMTPILWWTGMCERSKLGKIAVEILKLPPTSAATERSFSMFGWIHNSKRNRLTVERSGKLTYIAYNKKLSQNKCNVLEYEEEDEDDATDVADAEETYEDETTGEMAAEQADDF